MALRGLHLCQASWCVPALHLQHVGRRLHFQRAARDWPTGSQKHQASLARRGHRKTAGTPTTTPTATTTSATEGLRALGLKRATNSRQGVEARKTRESQPDHAAACPYAAAVRAWTERVVIGAGLCPWAAKSSASGRLEVVTCCANSTAEALKFFLSEAARLAHASTAALQTTLVVCPHVEAWRDFARFEDWEEVDDGVTFVEFRQLQRRLKTLSSKVSFVTFHPAFLRWRSLPPGLGVGSQILAHYASCPGPAGSRRSDEPKMATILSMDPRIVGVRHAALRFSGEMDQLRDLEQIVPVDWLVPDAPWGPPLPDNDMHRAPYPSLHIIRAADLKLARETELGQHSGNLLQMKNVARMCAHAKIEPDAMS
ncbi:unnamed protein product, partial [Polarella glacialis]